MKNKSKFAIIFATVLIAAATVAIVHSLKRPSDTKPRYVFLFIGDGMGLPHAAIADSFLAYRDSCYGGRYLSFSKFPVTGITLTACSNRAVTDSPAAGTAIACGQKTSVDRIGTAPDGSPLKSIAYDLKEEGYRVGIISDGPVNHATPAAFFAHSDSRARYYEIALEMASCGLDFLGGSEIAGRYGTKRDREDVVKLIEKDGQCDVCFGLEDFAGSKARTRVLLPVNPEDSADFDKMDTNKNYELAMAGKGMQASDFLNACLDSFGDGEPFFIMCEQGYIDWASHKNDIMRVMESVRQLDRAVAIAYEFYLGHPDETLILVTGDHETGGLTFGTKNYTIDWKAFEEIWDGCGHDDSGFTPEEVAAVSEKCGFGWGSKSHTGCPVPLYAIGKGAEKFTGVYENSDIKGKILGE